MNSSFKENSKIFKAFCDENRLNILYLLQNGEMCACRLIEELKLTQSNLSYHMKILSEAGVVSFRQEGKWTHYRLNPEGIERARDILESLKERK